MRIKLLKFISAIACDILAALAATAKRYEIKEIKEMGKGEFIENATIISPGRLYLKDGATAESKGLGDS
ncbi:hypothetical protein [Citrobacter farmeri]|uniref:hypothetical protein n=1 Tax=Citrobacter farmeri TaxID=67824 RepID=UPI00189E4B52|nr:hypothetical protein [Citrobacter farmeri]MBU5646924.1 hypothetical protein [Pluralibacter sp. S54_ASV_43]HAT3753472.1 hypothetical protein [Citrobacter amalonaticus]HAU5706296.1 hypothetical protein [Citrobacter freundii]EHK0943578.1 hypothetical protein [Citrobacter farmeri]EKU0079157.1 hypothetical protein [Citrobacter farmeri]